MTHAEQNDQIRRNTIKRMARQQNNLYQHSEDISDQVKTNQNDVEIIEKKELVNSKADNEVPQHEKGTSNGAYQEHQVIISPPSNDS